MKHVGVKVLKGGMKESEKDVLRDDENYRLRDVNVYTASASRGEIDAENFSVTI